MTDQLNDIMIIICVPCNSCYTNYIYKNITWFEIFSICLFITTQLGDSSGGFPLQADIMTYKDMANLFFMMTLISIVSSSNSSVTSPVLYCQLQDDFKNVR